MGAACGGARADIAVSVHTFELWDRDAPPSPPSPSRHAPRVALPPDMPHRDRHEPAIFAHRSAEGIAGTPSSHLGGGGIATGRRTCSIALGQPFKFGQLEIHRRRNTPPLDSSLASTSCIRRRHGEEAADGQAGDDEPFPQRPHRGVSWSGLCLSRHLSLPRRAAQFATRCSPHGSVSCHMTGARHTVRHSVSFRPVTGMLCGEGHSCRHCEDEPSLSFSSC